TATPDRRGGRSTGAWCRPRSGLESSARQVSARFTVSAIAGAVNRTVLRQASRKRASAVVQQTASPHGAGRASCLAVLLLLLLAAAGDAGPALRLVRHGVRIHRGAGLPGETERMPGPRVELAGLLQPILLLELLHRRHRLGPVLAVDLALVEPLLLQLLLRLLDLPLTDLAPHAAAGDAGPALRLVRHGVRMSFRCGRGALILHRTLIRLRQRRAGKAQRHGRNARDDDFTHSRLPLLRSLALCERRTSRDASWEKRRAG